MFGFALTNCSEAAASLQSNPEVSFPRLLEAGKILCFQAGLLLEKNAHQDLLNRKNCLSQPSGGGEIQLLNRGTELFWNLQHHNFGFFNTITLDFTAQ